MIMANQEQKRYVVGLRSEEHTSELQSRQSLVCRLLLEKKNKHNGLLYIDFNISDHSALPPTDFNDSLSYAITLKYPTPEPSTSLLQPPLYVLSSIRSAE